jgi:hypothetical protein
MDPQPLTQTTARSHATAHSRLYAAQARAFIEASEIVDADPATIEDILDGLDEETLSVEDDSDVDVDNPHDDRAPLVDDQDEELLALLQEGAFLDASS